MTSVKTKGTAGSKATTKKQSKSKSVPALIVPDAWVNEVASIDINDNEWRCSVVILEETSPTMSMYLDHFNEAAVKGTRLAVKTISHVEVVEFVKKNFLRDQNKKKTPIDLLCKEIYTDVGPNFEKMIPTSLLAHLLVYIILEYKDLNKKIRKNTEDKNKELEEYRQSIWPSVNFKTASAKSDKTGIKSNVTGKSGKVQTKTKVYTKLTKRGEEWKDKSLVDDAPIDGPQLYIALSNFYDPSLPLELLRLNVPLNAIIELSHHLSENTYSNDLSNLHNNLVSFRKNYSHVLSTRISAFWKEINTLKNKLPTSLLFKNVMFLQFLPYHSVFEHDIEAFQEEIYRQISHFMFDIFDNYKLYKAYTDALEITDVTDDQIDVMPNMQVYNSVLDIIPHEVLSIACILEAILTQVCCSEVDEQTQHEDSLTQLADGTLDSVLRYVKRLNIEYDLYLVSNNTDDSNNTDNSDFEKSSKFIQSTSPITKILAHSDIISIKTFHLEEKTANFIISRTKHILRTAWKDFWAKYFVQNDSDYNFINLCNEIIKSEKKFDQHALYYYIYLLIVNCILNSVLMTIDFDALIDSAQSTIRNSAIKEKVLFYNKSDLCEDCICEICSILAMHNSYQGMNSEQVSGSASSYSLTDDIFSSKLFYIEDMSSDILLQNLQAVYTKFNKFETRYCPFTEQLVIVFHNIHSTGPIREETWVGKLTTDVPERDFVEYILEEEAPWFDSYISKTFGQSPVTTKMNLSLESHVGIPTMILFSDSQFFSHRSLKYEQLMKKQTSPQTFPQISSVTKFDNYSLTKETMINENNVNYLDTDKQEEIDLKKDSLIKINGYKLGDPQRFQFTGFVKEKLFEDGTKIMLNKVQKLYGDTLSTLNLTVNGHTLYYNYKPTPDTVTPFHINLSSGVILYFGVPNFEKNNIFESKSSHKSEPIFEPLPELTEIPDVGLRISNSLNEKPSTESPDPAADAKSDYGLIKFPHQLKEANFHMIPSIYDFKMSTPSGLHVELVQLEYKDILYVRQKLLSKDYKSKMVQLEEFRCCLSSGCIIKFMIGGEIEVLEPNGAIYSIYEIKEIMEDNMSNKDITISHQKDSEGKDKLSVTDKTTKSKKKKNSNKTNKKKESNKYMDQNVSSRTNSEQLLNALKQSLNKETHLKLNNYKYTTSFGKQHVVKGSITETIEDLLMIDSIDISNNCINSERLDGLKSTHHADGSLTVYFPDGSCITSIPTETEEIFCEWSNAEFDLWFSSSTEGTSSTTIIFSNKHSESNQSANKKREESIVPSIKNTSIKSLGESFFLENDSKVLKKNSDGSFKNSVVSILHENSVTLSSNYGSIKPVESGNVKSKNKIIYSEDGFVVYSLNYLLEHPDYASIHFDSGNREIEFKLPFLNSISLKSDGSFKALVEGGNLIIGNDEIYFNRLNENGNITRIVVVNRRGPVYDPDDQVKRGKNVSEGFTESNINILSPEIKNMLINFHSLDSYFLYSVNELGNQVFIDFDLNMYEIIESNVWYGVEGNDLGCYVINKDLSGFKLISDLEVNQHVEFVRKHHGLVRKSENIWSSILTSLPMLQNESQRWFMKSIKTPLKTNIKTNVSTFGRRESWTKPFVKQDTADTSFTESDVMVVRILNKIPTQENILSQLKSALQVFRRSTRSLIPIKISIDSTKGAFNLTELANDPSILNRIYEEQRRTAVKENDEFRNNMKNLFLRSLIRQACIKARRIRQKNKVEEFKYVLRTKDIPPYHLSCFGQVHSILDEVLGNVNTLRKTPSGFVRVYSIIDEILNLATDSSTATDSQSKKESSDGSELIHKVISEIFDKFCDLSKVKSYQNLINTILEKPLASVTPEEIELLCRPFESGSGDCPILNDEEVVLQDVLEARHQLSHYFHNLKEILQYYRDHVLPQSSFEKLDCE